MARVELRDIVRKRRMVHQFTREPVADEMLLRILEVARHAPSAGFSQGFRLGVLAPRARVESFWRVTPPPDELGELDERTATGPPVVVLPFTSKAAYLDRYSAPDKAGFGLQTEEAWPVPFWHVDAGMAIMLILLAAVDEGLGGWYFGIVHGESDLLPELGTPINTHCLEPLQSVTERPTTVGRGGQPSADPAFRWASSSAAATGDLSADVDL